MTEALSDAKRQVSNAVEARIVELMATAVAKMKAEIARAVLVDVSDPFDEDALNDAIADQLGSWDFSGEINLASCEVVSP